MSISNVYPVTSPTLLMDFSNSRTLDPRIAFSRATVSGTTVGTAYYYDGISSTKAEQNLLSYSQELANGLWTATNLTVAPNSVVAPDGTTTGETLSASAPNATLTQTLILNSGNHTISAWIKRVSGSGTIEMTLDSAGTWSSIAITSTWTRYTLTQNLATVGSKTPGIRITTGGDQIDVWGVQLEERAFATYYSATGANGITIYNPTLIQAAQNVPRFENNPNNGELLGVLIEDQATNLLTYSSDFSNGVYVKTNVSVDTASTIAPDGTLTSNKVYIDNVSNSNVFNFVTQTITANASYAISVYAKANEFNYLFLGFNTSGTEYAVAQFNLSNSTIQHQEDTSLITPGYELVGSAMFALGNGWHRCEVIIKSANTTENIMISPASVPWTGGSRPGTAQNGNGFSGIQLWGAQFEATPNVTSYIPTTTTTITRVADTAYITGSNNMTWLAQGAGTFLTISYNFIPLGLRPIISLDDDTTNNEIRLYAVNATPYLGVKRLNVTEASVTGALFNRSVQIIIAGKYKNNNFYVSVNNNNIASDLSGTVPEGLTYLRIGADKAGNRFNGIISKIAYYPDDIDEVGLQALTSNNNPN